MNTNYRSYGATKTVLTFVVLLAAFVSAPAVAQQFVTDDYAVMPYRSSNLMLSGGDRNVTVLPSIGLFPNWEIFAGATLVWEDEEREADDHFSTIALAKRSLWVNERDTGGLAFSIGTGLNPDHYDNDMMLESFRNAYGVVEISLPFFHDHLQWDINPGISANWGDAFDGTTWDFTYATRLAWIKALWGWSPIAEVWGSAGDLDNDPQYKAGFRWEPNANFRLAVTYGGRFDGEDGSGFELGIICVTDPGANGSWPWKADDE